ncbi:MAG TPA: VOC family protein [Ilumatobacter sp.]|nr:VOC family protein [Ilumatobacter sp.]
MSEPVGSVDSVVINVLDIERQTAFWGAVLGADVAHEVPANFVWFAAQRPGGVQVALQAVEAASDGPRRLHLDLGVADREAAKRRVLELGGSHVADRQVGSFVWSVMADPEGNEFCLAVHD